MTYRPQHACFFQVHAIKTSLRYSKPHEKKKTKYINTYGGVYGEKNHVFPCLLPVLQLQRAWKAMKWIEKLNLVLTIFRGIASSSNISVNKLKVSLFDQHITILVYIIFSCLR